MSKSANKRASHAAFLTEAMLQKAEERREKRLEVYKPPPYRHGFIVKPTNPGWIAALERKARQYKDRCEEHVWDWQSRYRLALIEAILRNGEVNIETARETFKKDRPEPWLGRTLSDYQECESIIFRYCTMGGKGVPSFGGFLPTDENYDANFV